MCIVHSKYADNYTIFLISETRIREQKEIWQTQKQIKQAIAEATMEIARATMMAITESIEGSRKPSTGARQATIGKMLTARTVGPSLRQPKFNWEAEDKYMELEHSQMEVRNNSLATHYDINKEGKVRIKILARQRRIFFTNTCTNQARVMQNSSWIV